MRTYRKQRNFDAYNYIANNNVLTNNEYHIISTEPAVEIITTVEQAIEKGFKVYSKAVPTMVTLPPNVKFISQGIKEGVISKVNDDYIVLENIYIFNVLHKTVRLVKKNKHI